VRSKMLLACVAGVVFGVAGVSRAEEQAQAIIDKAIKAKGGEEALAKYKAVTSKGKGMFYGMGDGIPFTMETAEQLPHKTKQAVNAEVGGNPFKMTTVINGDQGWVNTNGDTTDMEKERLDAQKGLLHADFVITLIPLKDKAYTLSPLGESKQGDKALVGVKVSRKGHKDVSLFFNKDTGLLAKAEYKGMDMTGQEVNQEVTFGDYKDVDGIKEPMKITIKHDGQKYIESETTEMKHHKKLDVGVFAKP